jgi:uncharacterized protein (TIGR00295 family)
LTGAKGKPADLPSRAECLRILREHGCDDEVVSHCEAVSALAVRIAKKCRGNVHLVEIGGLLHDLGRCKSHTISHAVEGAKLATALKLPEDIVKIIERHIGAGITSKGAERLGLPRKDYTPKTLEEKIVAHADNLMSGSTRTGIEEAVANIARKGEHEAALKVLRLHEELSKACGTNIDNIV